MNIKTFLFLLLFTFSGLTKAQKIEYINLKVIFVDGYEDIPHQQYNEDGYPAFAGMYQGTQSRCVIWIKEPSNWTDFEHLEILGHEVLHCLWGPHKPGDHKEIIDAKRTRK